MSGITDNWPDVTKELAAQLRICEAVSLKS